MVKDKSDSKRIKCLLHNWYRSHAKKIFNQKVQVRYEKIKKYPYTSATCNDKEDGETMGELHEGR
jgi:hypothetical protein